MNYTPSTNALNSCWFCWAPEEPEQSHLLPPDLFQKLKAGIHRPENTYFLAVRTYATEAEALADLRQAQEQLQ